MGTHHKMKAAGLLALRLVVGFIFIYQGLNKLMWSHAGASGMFTKMGLIGGGEFWAYLIGGLELLGGIMVLLGAYAPYAATWLSVIMIVAMATVHRGGPVPGYFMPLSLLGSCLALIGVGAGPWRLVKTQCHCKDCKMQGGAGCGGNGACACGAK